MSKGQQTREYIIEKASELFNTKGYAASSMSDLMSITGLKKGGIYNHFTDKNEIALEAFKFAYARLESCLFEALNPARSERERLMAVLDFYRHYATRPIVLGGCPILNTLVDADHVSSSLIKEARFKTQRLLKLLERVVARGQKAGEFSQTVDPRSVALVLFSGIEGALLMTRACRDDQAVQSMIACLESYLQQTVFI